MTDKSEDVWAILYEDADKVPEVFVGSGAEECARRRYVQASDNWSCHLLCGADSARQPSMSAKDVALRCLALYSPDDSARDWADKILTYADTLANESSPNLDPTAGLGPADLEKP